MPMSRADICAEVLASCGDNVHPVGVLSAVGGVAPAGALAASAEEEPNTVCFLIHPPCSG